MREKWIIGNWKMNKTMEEAQDFVNNFSKSLVGADVNKFLMVRFGIATPLTNLPILTNWKRKYAPQFLVGAQNLHAQPSGAYTGEISGKMLTNAGCDFVIVGHSERRQYFHESDDVINEKLKAAINNNLVPILCVGETLKQYEAGQTKVILEKQLSSALMGVDITKIVIAYEPIWAIGTGRTASTEVAQDICHYIRTLTDDNAIIQYGGSVNVKNIDDLMRQPDIDGALIGGASLDPTIFWELVNFNH